eukprot:56580_1
MANCGTHALTIKWNQLQKLLETDNELDESHTFSIAGLNWKIMWSNDKGSFKVFLRLTQVPSHFEFILVQCNIECLETLSSFIFMKKYANNHMSHGWAKDTMTIEEIKNLQIEQISLKINLKILTIHSIKNELLFSDLLSIKSSNEIKWEI